MRTITTVLSLFLAAFLLFAPLGLTQDLTRGKGRPFEGGAVNVDQLTDQASVIVRGVLGNPQVKMIDRVIYTEYPIQVQETLKGPARNQLTVAVIGGALGNVALKVPGAPVLTSGDEMVFFGQPFQGQPSFKPVGGFSGLVPIQRGLGGTAAVAQGGVPAGLEEFLEEVRSRAR